MEGEGAGWLLPDKMEETDMKDFLYLFIGGHEESAKRSPEEMQKNMEQWMTWIGTMREAGIYKGGDPLEAEARTIAGADGVVTDGPFAEAKEVVGGYILISVKDMEAATEHARGCPIYADGGRVEIRPIMHIEGL